MKYRKGELVDIFQNAQTREGHLGRGKLISYVRTGDPFIIERNPVSEQLTLNYELEYWIVELDNFTSLKAVRTVRNIGPTTSNFFEEHIFDNTPATNLVEQFVTLPDYDTSFWDSRVDNTECAGSVF